MSEMQDFFNGDIELDSSDEAWSRMFAWEQPEDLIQGVDDPEKNEFNFDDVSQQLASCKDLKVSTHMFEGNPSLAAVVQQEEASGGAVNTQVCVKSTEHQTVSENGMDVSFGSGPLCVAQPTVEEVERVTSLLNLHFELKEMLQDKCNEKSELEEMLHDIPHASANENFDHPDFKFSDNMDSLYSSVPAEQSSQQYPVTELPSKSQCSTPVELRPKRTVIVLSKASPVRRTVNLPLVKVNPMMVDKPLNGSPILPVVRVMPMKSVNDTSHPPKPAPVKIEFSDMELKDMSEKYLHMRSKNNVASKRYRLRKKQKMQDLESKVHCLVKTEMMLLQKNAILRRKEMNREKRIIVCKGIISKIVIPAKNNNTVIVSHMGAS